MREHPEYKYRPRRKPKPMMGKKEGVSHTKYPGFPSGGYAPFFPPNLDPLIARSLLSNPYHAAAAAACASALSGSLAAPSMGPEPLKPSYELGLTSTSSSSSISDSDRQLSTFRASSDRNLDSSSVETNVDVDGFNDKALDEEEPPKIVEKGNDSVSLQ